MLYISFVFAVFNQHFNYSTVHHVTRPLLLQHRDHVRKVPLAEVLRFGDRSYVLSSHNLIAFFNVLSIVMGIGYGLMIGP